ncbi:hypothetical protein [Ensifer sp. LC163]|uniref:hypothetical protein n=1 Tax=Ensifer sp. LC163 TaxID=1120652 RepID=UPI0013747403|nr:hypothetical protein [Ensifer sp. LC163]
MGVKNHWKLSTALIARVTAFAGVEAQARQSTAPGHAFGRLAGGHDDGTIIVAGKCPP